MDSVSAVLTTRHVYFVSVYRATLPPLKWNCSPHVHDSAFVACKLTVYVSLLKKNIIKEKKCEVSYPQCSAQNLSEDRKNYVQKKR